MSFIGDKLGEMMRNSTYKRLPIYRDIVELIHEGYGGCALNVVMPDGSNHSKTRMAITTYPNVCYVTLDENATPSEYVLLRDLYDNDETVWYEELCVESSDYPLYFLKSIWVENGEVYISAVP